MDFKNMLKNTVATLAVVWALNQINITRNLVQRALTGQ